MVAIRLLSAWCTGRRQMSDPGNYHTALRVVKKQHPIKGRYSSTWPLKVFISLRQLRLGQSALFLLVRCWLEDTYAGYFMYQSLKGSAFSLQLVWHWNINPTYLHSSVPQNFKKFVETSAFENESPTLLLPHNLCHSTDSICRVSVIATPYSIYFQTLMIHHSVAAWWNVPNGAVVTQVKTMPLILYSSESKLL